MRDGDEVEGRALDLRGLDAPHGPRRDPDAPRQVRGLDALGDTEAANHLAEPDVKRLDLHALPITQRDGPIYLNVLRHLDLPQAAAMVAERSTLAIYTVDDAPWQYAKGVAAALNLGEKRVQIRQPLDAATK